MPQSADPFHPGFPAAGAFDFPQAFLLARRFGHDRLFFAVPERGFAGFLVGVAAGAAVADAAVVRAVGRDHQFFVNVHVAFFGIIFRRKIRRIVRNIFGLQTGKVYNRDARFLGDRIGSRFINAFRAVFGRSKRRRLA